MSHAVARCFQVVERGFIREGYFADLVLVDLNQTTLLTRKIYCINVDGARMEGFTFPAAITHTFVNGNLVYGEGVWDESAKGKRLQFNR